MIILKKFSIIITAYNVEQYIEKAIDSVLSQTYNNYEMIIVDDSSTDATVEKISKYKHYEQVKIFCSKQNKGAGGARNKGVSLASGEYIIYLDGDDVLYSNDVLQKIDKLLGNTKVDILFLGYQEIGGLNRIFIPSEETTKTKEQNLQKIIDLEELSVCSKCWRREFLIENEIVFIEHIFYEDMIYLFETYVKMNRWSYGEILIFKYTRDRDGSVMTKPSIKRCSDLYRYMSYLMELYPKFEKKEQDILMKFIHAENERIPERIEHVLNALEENNNITVTKI